MKSYNSKYPVTLMFEGKTKAAIRLLTEEAKGGLLRLSDQVDINRTVRDVLIDKHLSGQPAHPESLIEDDPPDVHPVLFKSIDASVIRPLQVVSRFLVHRPHQFWQNPLFGHYSLLHMRK